MTSWNDDQELGAEPGEDKEWTPHPEGTFPMALNRVFDAGWQSGYKETDFAGQTVVLVFESTETLPDGGPRYLMEKSCRLSLGKRSIIRKMMTLAFGKDESKWPKMDDGKTVRIRGLEGQTFAVTIEHKEKDGDVRAKVVDIGGTMKGTPPVICQILDIDTDRLPFLSYLRDNAITAERAREWNERAKELERKKPAPAAIEFTS